MFNSSGEELPELKVRMAIVIEHYKIVIDINSFWLDKTLVTAIGTWTHDSLLTQTPCESLASIIPIPMLSACTRSRMRMTMLCLDLLSEVF